MFELFTAGWILIGCQGQIVLKVIPTISLCHYRYIWGVWIILRYWERFLELYIYRHLIVGPWCEPWGSIMPLSQDVK